MVSGLGRTRKTYLERAEQTFVDAHHSTSVVEFAAVVGGTKQSNELALREELVSVLDNLVSTADQIHVVFLKEARNDIRTEGEGNTTIVFAPTGNVLIGIRPQEIAKKTAVRNLVFLLASQVTAICLSKRETRACMV